MTVEFSRPRRLHPATMVIEALRGLRSWSGAIAFPVLASVFGDRSGSVVGLLVVMLVVIAAGAAAWGYASWRATSYDVRGGMFVFRRGIVQKSERSIPIDHIQSVDTVQGVVQRLFRVVEVRIETAGGGSSGRGRDSADAALPALSRSVATALQAELAAARPEPVEAEQAEAAGPTLIRRMGFGDVLLAGATSGQIGIALPLIYGASQYFDNLFSEERIRGLVGSVLPGTFAAVAFILGAVLLLSWLAAIIGTFWAYYGFTLYRDGENLRITRGLIERREVTIPISRIQAVRTVEGVLRQPLGLALVRMESAGYGKDAGVSMTLFPLLPRKAAAAFLEAVAPEFAAAPELRPLPPRSLRRYVFRESWPWTVLIAPAVLVPILADLQPPDWYSWAAPLGLAAAIGLSALYGWAQYRSAGWACERDCIVVRTRRLARTTLIAPRRRLQSRSVAQTPFQRRRRLATFRIEVASSGGGASASLVDMDAEEAFAAVQQLAPNPAA